MSAEPLFESATPRRIHVVGAGGAGMSGLAKLLAQMGHTVSGSDIKPGRTLAALSDVGVDVWVGHQPDRMDEVELVVVSSAVPESDPERVAAGRSGIPVWERPRLLDAITTAMPAIGIAGTHGKTTSTAMGVSALRACGLDPSFIVGGEMVDLNTGAHLGSEELFILEADEAFGTFRHLNLTSMLVTNIEADHLDHYETVAAVEDAFAQVAGRVGGPVLACVDDPGVRRLAQRTSLVTYGTDPGAMWRIEDVSHGSWEVSFRLVGAETIEVRIPQPGLHTARNAAGVIALLAELGFDPFCAAEGLSGFAGVHRRSEVRARTNGVTIIDDYAHHPTEVAAVVAAARLGDAERVWVVFQPHRFSRTADLAHAFGEPLAGADRVVVTDVFPAGESPLPGVTGRLVAESVTAAGGDVEYVPRLQDVADVVGAEVERGDVILLLGAGDVGTLADQLADLVNRR